MPQSEAGLTKASTSAVTTNTTDSILDTTTGKSDTTSNVPQSTAGATKASISAVQTNTTDNILDTTKDFRDQNQYK